MDTFVNAVSCECSDCQCGHCAGRCVEASDYTLYRVDMADYTGTAMCEGCAEDAIASGLFSEESAAEADDLLDDLTGACE
jgi:hypothetical protein